MFGQMAGLVSRIRYQQDHGGWNRILQMEARSLAVMDWARRMYPGATMVEVSGNGVDRTVTAPTRIPQHPKQETPQ